MVNTGEGGQDEGQLREGDGEVHGEPQEQADQAHGGGGVPSVMVSGLDTDQVQTGEKFDTNNISKLILDWDAMSKYHDGVTGLPGEEHEG